ncbi:hypothetical protein WI89_08065 [Burkholderia ubonensis]|nr:hypothetical protein WI89_08065 [Burkholderia ubonensis]
MVGQDEIDQSAIVEYRIELGRQRLPSRRSQAAMRFCEVANFNHHARDKMLRIEPVALHRSC